VPREAAAQSGVERKPRVRGGTVAGSWTFNRAVLLSTVGMTRSRGTSESASTGIAAGIVRREGSWVVGRVRTVWVGLRLSFRRYRVQHG
jgi:hypothetical protein